MTNCEFPAHCVNTSGGVSCLCSDGYIGDPPQCEGKCYWLGIYLLSKRLLEYGEPFVPKIKIASVNLNR